MRFSETGNSLAIILLIIGMVTGGVLIDKKIKPNPTPSPVPVASVLPEIDKNPTVALSVENNLSLNQLKQGDNFSVLVALSTNEEINLISTKIDYPKDLVKVTSIDDLGDKGVISLWVTKSDFPADGRVELIGGIPTPGIKTDGKRVLFGKINFQFSAPPAGKNFDIIVKEAALYSDKDNQPLKELVLKSLHIDGKVAEASPTAGGTSIPEPSPKENKKSKGSLSLSPAILQSSSSCTFDVTVHFDSDGSEFAGIDVLLTVDSRVLKPVKIVRSDNPPDILYAPQLSFTKDTVTIAYLSPKNLTYQKKGSLGKITFQVTDQPAYGLTAIKIKRNPDKKNDLTDSNIVYSLQEDLLSATSNTIVSITKGSCNNPAMPKSYEILPTR